MPHGPDDLAFGRNDLEEGYRRSIYERVSHKDAMEERLEGAVISTAFRVW